MNAPAKVGLLVQGAPGSVPGDGSVPVGHPAVRARKIGVLLVNLGTPDAPDAPAVRRYLKQFLSDPRVVEIPSRIWWFILNLFILPFRSGQSAAKYRTIWTREGSPLRIHTAQQAAKLQALLAERGHEDVKVAMAMRYGTPLGDALRVLSAEMRHEMLMRFETRAARLPVLMTIPMILFILPCIFLIVGGPAVIQVMSSLH